MPEAPELGMTNWSLPAKQPRSRGTRDRLIASGLKLLEKHDFDELKIASIAKTAKCSVGSFYWRFESKDHFFRALIEVFQSRRHDMVLELYAKTSKKTLVSDVIGRELSLIADFRNLWRAAILRGANDPAFWDEVRERGQFAIGSFLNYYASNLGRPLTSREEENIRFAFRMVRATINNHVLSEHGTTYPIEPNFIKCLERAFCAISGVSRQIGVT